MFLYLKLNLRKIVSAMESGLNEHSLAELSKLLPGTISKTRKALRCVVTEAVRDRLISDVPKGLVENERVTKMLEADFKHSSDALDTAMAEQAGAEQMRERRIFLESNLPVTPEDQDLLAEVKKSSR